VNLSFTLSEIKVIAAQIINALFYLHNRGIIYGDLKGENILVNEFGIIKLSDFNLSGTKSILNETLHGTLCYLAPEYFQKKERTEKVDFWALGVLLYFLWYRTYPFDTVNP